MLRESTMMEKSISFHADESITTTTNTTRLSLSSRSPSFSSVKFFDISVREYNLTIGDNPFCSSGCPISIGNQVLREVSIPIDEYEQSRAPRRGQSQMRIPKDARQEMLVNEWQIPFSQILETTAYISKIREQRQKDLKKYYRRKNKNWKKLLQCRKITEDVLSFSSLLPSNGGGVGSGNGVDDSQVEIPFLQPKLTSITLSKLRNANEDSGKGTYFNELDISNRGRILLDDIDDNQREERNNQGLDISNQTIQINNKSNIEKYSKEEVIFSDTVDDLDVSCRCVKLIDIDLRSSETHTLTDETDEDATSKDPKALDFNQHTDLGNTFDVTPQRVVRLDAHDEIINIQSRNTKIHIDHETDVIRNQNDIPSKPIPTQKPENASITDRLDSSSQAVRLPAFDNEKDSSHVDELDTSSRWVELDNFNKIIHNKPITIPKPDNLLIIDDLDSTSRIVRLSSFHDENQEVSSNISSLDSSSRQENLHKFNDISSSKSIPLLQTENRDVPASLDSSSCQVHLVDDWKSMSQPEKHNKNYSLDSSSHLVKLHVFDSKNEASDCDSLGVSPQQASLSDFNDMPDIVRRTGGTDCLDSLDSSSWQVKLDNINGSPSKHVPPLPNDYKIDSLDSSFRRVGLDDL